MGFRTLFIAIFLFQFSPPATWSQGQSSSFWEQKTEQFGNASQWDSLDATYRSYLSFLRQKDDLALWLFARWDWQSWYFDDNGKSLAILNEAASGAWREPHLPEEMEAMLWIQVNRGYHYFQEGNVVTSIGAYEQALKWYQLHPPNDFEALDYLFLPLGAHYTRLGDNEKARTLYELAISSHAGGVKDAALAGVYNNLGLTWWNEGNYPKALEAYRRGLLCKKLPDEKQGLLNLSLAQAFADKGQPDSASIHLEKAFTFFQKAPQSETLQDYRSGAWLLKGKLASEAGRFTEGEQAIRKALQLEIAALGTPHHRAVAKIHVAIGQLYVATSQASKALRSFNSALASLLPSFAEDDLKALPSASEIYEENSLLEALEGKAEAAMIQYHLSNDSAWAQLALRCHQLSGKVELRLRMLFQYESSKLSQQEKSRQRLEKALESTHELYLLTREEKYIWEGWHFAEQAKAMVLLEGILQQGFRSGNEEDASILAKRKQLAWYEKQLLLHPEADQRNTWLKERQTMLDELSAMERSRPAWQNFRQQMEQLSPAIVQQIALTHGDHVLLEIFSGKKSINIFSFDGKAKWWRLSESYTLQEKLAQLLQWLPSRTALDENRVEFCKFGSELFQELLQPALEGSKTAKPLLIIPDGLFSYLPFEALPTRFSESSWQKTPFLIFSHPVMYAFSLFVLDSQQKLPGQAPENLLQLAPIFENGERNLTPLLNSQQEAPGRFLCKSKHLEADVATFDAFAYDAGAYKILHLSTHAGVDSTGALPRIEFYDRTAWLPDIYALPLRADLVVLSACQTGLGKLSEGEGVMSLSRAFTLAGAKGLVASQWTINESASATILKDMYGRLRQGQPKYLALHEAKVAWLKNEEIQAFQKSPYYWAALVYVGDGQSVEFHSCLPWWLLGGITVLFAIFMFVRRLRQRSKSKVIS